jgi:hypothetical protein
MATYLKDINGGDYSVLEANFLAARRTGQVKAQLPLGEDFDAGEAVENGMFLVYDVAEGEVKKPTNGNTKELMLHFSVEKEYDNIRPGLNSYAIFKQEGNAYPGTPYPRLFKPHAGDTFTTDAVRLSDSDLSAANALIAYNALTVGNVYGVGSDGFINATTSGAAAEGVRLRLVKLTTLPNGGYACKFEVAYVA